MSITKEFDTITAISTPLGEGAIGIVRLSGLMLLRLLIRFQRKKFRNGRFTYYQLRSYRGK